MDIIDLRTHTLKLLHSIVNYSSQTAVEGERVEQFYIIFIFLINFSQFLIKECAKYYLMRPLQKSTKYLHLKFLTDS